MSMTPAPSRDPSIRPGSWVRPIAYDPKIHDDIRGLVLEVRTAESMDGVNVTYLVTWKSARGEMADNSTHHHWSEVQPFTRETP